MSTLAVRPLDPDIASACAAMTYPAYRHLLALAPTQRHLGAPSQPLIQPIGAVAFEGNQIAGLALAEKPVEGDSDAELLSVYVPPSLRERGVASRLVEGIEDGLRAAGARRVQAVYMTGKPEIERMERIFAKRGWDKPAMRTLSVRFTPDEAARTAWYGRLRLGPDFEIFPWRDVTAEEKAGLRESQAREGWIATGLEPWKHDSYPFDPVSSIGARYKGQVVGWVINHPIDATTLRFTCSFMRHDLSRRSRILPLYSASIERARAAGIKLCTFVTPVEYGPMIEFVKRHCEKWVSFVGETRGVAKAL